MDSILSDSDSDIPPPNYDPEMLALQQQEQSNAETSSRRRRGSIINREVVPREIVHRKIMKVYFSKSPVYNAKTFRRRFRMSRNLFLRIKSAIEVYDSYFVQKRDAAGRLGLSSYQKITAAMRMLAYGVAADAVNEYVRIGESTLIEYVKLFVQVIYEVFGEEYLRSPNSFDIARLLSQGADRGFPGMLGSVDCMHWKWKNCPASWKGQYERGDHNNPTLVLEAVASRDCWI